MIYSETQKSMEYKDNIEAILYVLGFLINKVKWVSVYSTNNVFFSSLDYLKS